MKIRILKIIILIVFFLVYLKGNAQKKEFIVTNNNDTIYAEKIYARIDYIKIKNEGKKIKYDIKNIKSYYKSKYNSHFIKISSPVSWWLYEEDIFIKRLTNGRIKLLHFFEGRGTNFTQAFFLQKEGVNLTELSTSQFKFGTKSVYQEIRKFVNDDSDILSELNSSKKIKKESLIELINKYNSKFRSN